MADTTHRGWTLTAQSNRTGIRISVVCQQGKRSMRIDNAAWQSQEQAIQSVQGTIDMLSSKSEEGELMLYHGCGRPILAVPLSSPRSREYLYFDGETDAARRTNGEIKECPGCGHELQHSDLSEKPGAASAFQDAG